MLYVLYMLSYTYLIYVGNIGAYPRQTYKTY